MKDYKEITPWANEQEIKHIKREMLHYTYLMLNAVDDNDYNKLLCEHNKLQFKLNECNKRKLWLQHLELEKVIQEYKESLNK